MKLSEFKKELSQLSEIAFGLPNGELVPRHFHVTEVGEISKKFIDCGGTLRSEKVISFQLWEENDYDHRLHPAKLMDIISLSERELQLSDLEIEVEYQSDTIGKYGVEFDGSIFQLISLTTTCLAKDKCGIPTEKPKIKLASIHSQNACAPGSGCC